MKFTLSWLKQHLELAQGATAEQLSAGLTYLGLEVEKMDNKGQLLKDFVIGEVIECGKHPNADKLSLCKVFDGKEKWQVVCGAPNVRQGLKVVLAHQGMTIPQSGMVLKKGNIRGVDSEAMICSAYELTLGDDHDGIIELADTAPVGENYANWAGLDDTLFEIKLTPNRGDCLGVRGIARDLAAADFGELKPLSWNQHKGDFASPIEWQIDKSALPACPIVMGRYFKGVKNGESPAWLKQKLMAVGLKSISALVDITNYFSQDMARPLHVFSGKSLKGKNLTMRYAREGEKIMGLDNIEYNLTPAMLVIADDKRPVSIAGIMGGLDSGCQMDDDEVFLEVAYFDPMTIAQTGRALQVQSDARYRFERGIDPMGLEQGLELATAMILEICGGTASAVTMAGSPPPAPSAIDFDPTMIKKLGGVEMETDIAKTMLTRLGFEINDKKTAWQVTPPSWRSDIGTPACLVEEVLRLYGFDKVAEVPLPRQGDKLAIDIAAKRIMTMRRALCGRGFDEAITWSFTEADRAKDFGGKNLVAIKNPIHNDLTIMRPSILCNLMTVLMNNNNRGVGNLNLFESGLVFYGTAPEQQQLMIAGVRHGAMVHWQEKDPVDVFTIKADILSAIESVGFPTGQLQLRQDNLPPHYHPKMAGGLYLGKEVVGYFGAIHPALTSKYDLDRVLAFEIFLAKIPEPKKQKSRTRSALQLNDLPMVVRDFAFLVGEEVPVELLVRSASKADKKFIKDVVVFDIYPPPFGEKKKDMGHEKSVALRVTMMPDDKTLSDGDIKTLSEKIIAEVMKATNGKLRS